MRINKIHRFEVLLTASLALSYVLIAVLLTNTRAVYAAPQTFTVINTDSTGAGSLAQAVIDANSNNNPSEQDIIEFDINDDSTVTITPESTLEITEPVIINGYTQGDAQANTQEAPLPFNGRLRVQIDTSESGAVSVSADNVTLQGLAIHNGETGNITVTGVSGFKLFGSYIDTLVDGLTPQKSTSSNKSLIINDAPNVQIGSALPAERNLFANCSLSCIEASGSNTTNLNIKGNYIGLGSDGLTSLENYAIGGDGGVGIKIFDEVSDVEIGGTESGAGNSIERNYLGAISVADSSDVRVLGNRIVFNFNHDIHSGEGDAGGIFFGGVTDSIIGSVGAGKNLIVGNRQGSIIIADSDEAPSSNIKIEGNHIGVMEDGTTLFPNTDRGIEIEGQSTKIRIANNRIHGADGSYFEKPAAGVRVADSASLISILDNSVYKNEGLGIINTSSDEDKISAPMYSSAVEAGDETEISYSLIAPAGDYRIEFFSNEEPDESGLGEGQTKIGHHDITKSESGWEQFTHTLDDINHQNISLTATSVDEDGVDDFGTTSQFGGLQFHADLEVSTNDNLGLIAEDASSHTITQTITNLGSSSLDAIEFTLATADCFSLTSAASSGTATNNGAYNTDTHTWEGLLESGQTLELTFTGSLTCGGGNTLVFIHTLQQAFFQNTEVVDYNTENNHYAEYTDIITPVDLSFETADGANSILSDVASHQMTQTITNHSDTTVTDIAFNGLSFGCASLSEITLSGTATNFGTYDEQNNTWNGALAADQTLVFTFEVTLTCGGGNTLTLEHSASEMQSSGDVQHDLNQDNNDYTDTTAIVNPVTDFELTKTLQNPEDLAIDQSLNYTVKFTNHGPQPFDISIFTGDSPGTDQLFFLMLPAELDYLGFTSDDNIACTSFGPGSAAGFESAMANHSDFTMVNCYSESLDEQVLEANEGVTGTLIVKPNNTSDRIFTTYGLANFGPYDTDVSVLNGLGSNDVIDYILQNPINNFVATPVNPDDLDDDGDSIANGIENSGPNNGDGNNDGTPDAEQSHVASFISPITNKPVVLVVSHECSIVTNAIINESATGQADVKYEYPLGLMNFILECARTGMTTPITHLYYDETDQGYVLRKYYADRDLYGAIQKPDIFEQTIANQNVLTLSYKVNDGGKFDADDTKNGIIVDPAGLAIKIPPWAKLSDSGHNQLFALSTGTVLVVLANIIFFIRK